MPFVWHQVEMERYDKVSDSIEQFWSLARKASFHYADDSTKEWGLGRDAKSKAISMLRRNPNRLTEIRANVKYPAYSGTTKTYKWQSKN